MYLFIHISIHVFIYLPDNTSINKTIYPYFHESIQLYIHTVYKCIYLCNVNKPTILVIFLFRTDPSTSSILEAMRSGAMSMKQAADALGMETAMLAYHLAAKV